MHTSNMISRTPLLTALVLALMVFAGCDTDPSESLYEPDALVSEPDPAISGVAPDGGALAGVDLVTITGQNFSTEADRNLVYFDTERAQVVEATATSLVVVPPNTPSPAINLRIAVLGAENFSNTVTYRLDAASEVFGDILSFEEPFAITSDDAGNLYMTLFADSRAVGIKRITPEGERSDYIESTFKWEALDFDASGNLYAVRNVRAIFRFAGEGARQETWAVLSDRSARLGALTIDGDGMVWAGGNNTALYRANPDAEIQEFPFEANVRDLVAFDGHLYALNTQGESTVVTRFPITAPGELGAPEEYFNVTAELGASVAGSALAFASNGDMFLGTDAADPVIVVAPDGSWETLYPGILSPVAFDFAWGQGATLYMNQGRTEETNPGLIKINTRREGAR